MAGLIPMKYVTELVAKEAAKSLSKPTSGLSYIMKKYPLFEQALKGVAEGKTTKIIVGPQGSTANPIQLALAELLPSKIAVVGKRGYAPYPHGRPVKHIGGFVYSSNTPNIPTNYTYISNPLLKKELPKFNKAEQDLIMEQIERINPILEKHHSKQFDEGFITQMTGRYKNMPEDKRITTIRKLLGTNGLNFNKKAGDVVLPEWNQGEFDILNDAYGKLAAIMPQDIKRITGGLNNTAFPYVGNVLLNGGGKSYTDVVKGIPIIQGKQITNLPSNLKLNDYEALLYKLIKSGENDKLRGAQNLIITDIKDPTLGVSYGSLPEIILQAKKGAKFKNNRWKLKQ